MGAVDVASDVDENNSNGEAAAVRGPAVEGGEAVKATHDGAEIKARYTSGTNTLIAGDGTFMIYPAVNAPRAAKQGAENERV